MKKWKEKREGERGKLKVWGGIGRDIRSLLCPPFLDQQECVYIFDGGGGGGGGGGKNWEILLSSTSRYERGRERCTLHLLTMCCIFPLCVFFSLRNECYEVVWGMGEIGRFCELLSTHLRLVCVFLHQWVRNLSVRAISEWMGSPLWHACVYNCTYLRVALFVHLSNQSSVQPPFVTQ